MRFGNQLSYFEGMEHGVLRGRSEPRRNTALSGNFKHGLEYARIDSKTDMYEQVQEHAYIFALFTTQSISHTQKQKKECAHVVIIFTSPVRLALLTT
jgi:hypothetical protein